MALIIGFVIIIIIQSHNYSCPRLLQVSWWKPYGCLAHKSIHYFLFYVEHTKGALQNLEIVLSSQVKRKNQKTISDLFKHNLPLKKPNSLLLITVKIWKLLFTKPALFRFDWNNCFVNCATNTLNNVKAL